MEQKKGSEQSINTEDEEIERFIKKRRDLVEKKRKIREELDKILAEIEEINKELIEKCYFEEIDFY